MEKMPFRERAELRSRTSAGAAAVSSSWQEHLPVLSGADVELRELRISDAPSLFAMLTSEEVARFISPPPTTVVPDAAATASATARVPAANGSSSNAPIGPFQKTVPACATSAA